MLWWYAAGCFLITADERLRHDRALRQSPPEDTGPAFVHLTVTAEHLEAYKGWPVWAAVVDDGQVVSRAADTVRKGGFDVGFPEGLDVDRKYKVDLFVDGAGDGVCDPSLYDWSQGVDVLFRIKAVQADEPGPLDVALDPSDDADSAACDSFAASWGGSGA